MRIARVLTRLNLGGPARQVMASDPLLMERGHRVRVFAGEPEPGEGSLAEELRSAGVEVIPVPGLVRGVGPGSLAGDLRARRFLRAELASFVPDVVHTHAAKAGAIGRRAAAQWTPAAARVHTFHGHVLEGYFPRPVSWALRRAERRLARITDAILAVSEATRSDLDRFGVAPAEDIEVVPPGTRIDPLMDLPVERPGSAFRAELGIGPSDTLVVMLGRLAPVKRPLLGLEVFAQVAREFPSVHLAYVGDGGLASPLGEAVRGLPAGIGERVHLVGARNDVGPVHQGLDVLLSTSFSEGVPVAMIEAAAAARPVVSTAVGGVPELVRNGVTGLMAADGDGLAAALAGLVADPEERLRLGILARERVAERHSPQALADRLEAVYRRVVASRA